MNWGLFFSSFALIFTAELPDKTAFAVLLMSGKGKSRALFFGAGFAFLIQTLVAVLVGGFISRFPEFWIRLFSGLLFLGFSWMGFREMRAGRETAQELEHPNPKSLRRGMFLKSFLMIFAAEWGDITQLATASLVASHHDRFSIFWGAFLALLSVTAIAILLGHRLKRLIPEHRIQWFSSCLMGGIGIYFIRRAWFP